jgi:hypothetical protein
MRLWTGSMTALVLAGSLAGCNKAPDNAATPAGNATTTDGNAALPALPQALPMQAGAATSIGAAPPATALRASAPVQVASLPSPGDSYAYLDRAAGQSDAYGDAPPDYAFDYDGVSPWAWQAGDGSTEYAEPIEGGYRSYYYQPGQDRPYLVRDGDYSYAYAGVALVAIYLGGRLLPRQQWGDHARYAAGYRDRAEHLYRASRENRRGVIAANWAARRDRIVQQRGAWAAERAQQADWTAYHREHAVQEQAHWAQDRQQRAAAAQMFDAQRRQDRSGQAPGTRPDAGPALQDRRAENQRLPRTQPPTQPTPDRRDPQPPAAGGRPAERPIAADPPAARAAHERAPMLGGDADRVRRRGVRPLDAPYHEPERAAVRAAAPAPAEPRRAAARRDQATERPAAADRAAPRVVAPRPAPKRPAPPVAAPRPAARAEAPRERPHEAPHPAPAHASEPHGGGERRR